MALERDRDLRALSFPLDLVNICPKLKLSFGRFFVRDEQFNPEVVTCLREINLENEAGLEKVKLLLTLGWHFESGIWGEQGVGAATALAVELGFVGTCGFEVGADFAIQNNEVLAELVVRFKHF